MVITSRTRNAVVRKGTWVRIPPPPSTTNPRKSRIYAGLIMPFCGERFADNHLKESIRLSPS